MQITVDVITTRKEIYYALLESEDHQSIVGISSDDLGPGMFLTSVREILNDGDDVVVILSSYDTTGYFLEKNKVSLSSISGVVPFKAVFQNPFLKELQKESNSERAAAEKNRDYIF